MNDEHAPVRVGWREWVALPELGLSHVKAKVDTGARTSALHAFEIHPRSAGGRTMLEFGIHPLQGNREICHWCTAEALEQRHVTDSGGHRELRWVIVTQVRWGTREWPIEMTLTPRDNMRFRMLLGRTALKGAGMIVDPACSYIGGRRSPME